MWNYDFVKECTVDERSIRMFTVIAELSREAPADLVITKRVPDYTRPDNSPEVTAFFVRNWLGKIGVKTLFIEPGIPLGNDYNELVKSRMSASIENYFLLCLRLRS